MDLDAVVVLKLFLANWAGELRFHTALVLFVSLEVPRGCVRTPTLLTRELLWGLGVVWVAQTW